MKYTFFIVLILSIPGCHVKPDPTDQKPTDFLQIAKKVKDAGKIYLQGVEKSDLSGPYIIKEYYSDTLSFRLIFYPKSGDKDSVTLPDIDKAETNDFKDFICFAFVYPMTDPDKMKDYHADNVKYPVSVISYVRKAAGWAFLDKTESHSLTELSRFEIKSIYLGIK